MGRILLIRHGQASFEAEDYDRLSELGHEQARLLGNWLGHCGQAAAAIAVGGLRRHRETAECCLAAWPEQGRRAADYAVDRDLDEGDFADVIGCYRPDLADASAVRAFLAHSDNPRAAFQDVILSAMARWTLGAGDYRESWRTFRERCVAALMRVIAGQPRSQDVLVFTSAGPIAAICQHVLGLGDAHAATLLRPLFNSGVTTLLYRPGEITLSGLNAVGHLEAQGRRHLLTYR